MILKIFKLELLTNGINKTIFKSNNDNKKKGRESKV